MTRPPHGVELVERASAAGAVVLPPIDAHRVALHLSAETPSRCRETNHDCVRTRGDVDVIPAGAPGGYDAATASRALEIHLGRGFVERVAEEARLSRTVATQHLVPHPTIRRLAWAFAGNADHPARQLYLDSLGVALAVQLLSQGETSPVARGLTRTQLQRVIDYVEAHLDGELTLGELADVARVSPAHLRRWFGAQVGEPVHRYVVRRRVERARELLLAGDLPASEAALAVGFAHQSHMARWMRRLLGVTPRGLRRS
jgi:AraC family transcriptional regulator